MSESQEDEADNQLSFDCDDDTPCEQTLCETKRRKLLGALAAGSTIALAGCTGILAAPDETGIRGSDDEYELNFLREEERLTVTGSETVLRAAERNDLELNYVCRAGYCGQCLSRAGKDANEAVHMATNDVDDLTDEAVEAGYFLPCTSQPRDDFTLATNLAVDASVGDVLEEYQEEEEEVEEFEESRFVTYLVDGQPTTVEFEPEDDRDLLNAGEDEGLELEYRCRVGVCGQCVSKVSGNARDVVNQDDDEAEFLSEEDVDEGWVLPCVARPRDSFTMRANLSDEF